MRIFDIIRREIDLAFVIDKWLFTAFKVARSIRLGGWPGKYAREARHSFSMTSPTKNTTSLGTPSNNRRPTHIRSLQKLSFCYIRWWVSGRECLAIENGPRYPRHIVYMTSTLNAVNSFRDRRYSPAIQSGIRSILRTVWTTGLRRLHLASSGSVLASIQLVNT